MNIEKLIRKGRLSPIHKTNEKGETHIIGYRRDANSRKKNQQYMLRVPELVKPEAPAVAST